jgi:hypothetical protein
VLLSRAFVTWWRPERGSPLTNGDVHVNVHSSCFNGGLWGKMD